MIAFAFRRQLSRTWREPVLRYPVLVIDSDDWGAGPLSQALALREIAETLALHQDCRGRPPVLSLALVLAVPDGSAIRQEGAYRRVALDATLFAPILAELRDGWARGVFALQLHCLEHFWPPTLVACEDPVVAQWLRRDPPAETEQLPPHLQSRWVDASVLPSLPLDAAVTDAAVAEEVRTFERIFGHRPAAVVPPTFVWTAAIERAWAGHGVEFLATPGWRFVCRDQRGRPSGDEGPFANGDRNGALTYLVRTDYFEPLRGRDAGYALRALGAATSEGRACVLENHRDNFIGDKAGLKASLRELDTLCSGALQENPDLRFMSTEEFGRIVRDLDPEWVQRAWLERLPYVWQRLRHSGRLWKLMRVTGFAGLGHLIVRLLARCPPDRTSVRYS